MKKKKKPAAKLKRSDLARKVMTQALAQRKPSIDTLPEALEKVLILGDLTPLTPAERVDYYNRLCKTLGLNPLTRPFDYIAFKQFDDGEDNQPAAAGAKLSIYANKSCTEQLRKIHGVAVVGKLRREFITGNGVDDKILMVECDVKDRTGKTDTATGALMMYKMKKRGSDWVRYPLTGREYCNAIMKCETKAKRRATLSICGLGILDISELDTVRVVGGATADGKVFYHDEAEDPEQALLEEEAASRQHPDEAKLREQELWCEKHKGDSRLCPTAEHTNAELDRAWEAEQKNKKESGKPTAPPPPAKPKGTVEIDLSNPDSPILRGDIGNLLPEIQKHCTARFGDDSWWHILPKDVPTMHAMLKHYGYSVRVIEPAPAKTVSGKQEAKPEKTRASAKATAAPAEKAKQPAEQTLITGNIVRAVMGTTNNRQPVLNVRIGNEWHPCYRNTIFEHLTNRDGFVIDCYVDKNKSITGLKRVGKVEFEEDGKTPKALSVNREPGLPFGS